jgi:hypothetical protein
MRRKRIRKPPLLYLARLLMPALQAFKPESLRSLRGFSGFEAHSVIASRAEVQRWQSIFSCAEKQVHALDIGDACCEPHPRPFHSHIEGAPIRIGGLCPPLTMLRGLLKTIGDRRTLTLEHANPRNSD